MLPDIDLETLRLEDEIEDFVSITNISLSSGDSDKTFIKNSEDVNEYDLDFTIS